jgi:hypothetical protein
MQILRQEFPRLRDHQTVDLWYVTVFIILSEQQKDQHGRDRGMEGRSMEQEARE